VRADGAGGGDDEDDERLKPQLLLSSDGLLDVNPYAEKAEKDEEAPPEMVEVDHHDLPKGDNAAQKAAKSGSRETHGMWNALGDPLGKANAAKKKTNEKKLPVVSHTPLRRLGAARNKVTPEDREKKKKKLPAGSDGAEWWRDDGGMPPRKTRGGKASSGFGRREDDDQDGNGRPKTAPDRSDGGASSDNGSGVGSGRPKTSGGGRSKSPSKEPKTHHQVEDKEKTNKDDKAGARPKTPADTTKQQPPKSPKGTSKKKSTVRPATAPNPSR
jgi:hypothetical protein